MENIYNQRLENCGTQNMSNGSWDNEKKCSEIGGGVHQICVNNISQNTPNFSSNTGQTDWSNNRNNNNHCVCLGAWSLYNTKNNIHNNVLKCNAIPKIALSQNYVSKFSEGWNKWNGLEIDNQIVNGVESLVKMCYYQNSNESAENLNNLKKNYCNFSKNINALKNRQMFKNLCYV